jgi:hypothetical protein
MLTLSNPIFLPPAYSTALIYFGRDYSFKREKQTETERVQPAQSVG